MFLTFETGHNFSEKCEAVSEQQRYLLIESVKQIVTQLASINLNLTRGTFYFTCRFASVTLLYAENLQTYPRKAFKFANRALIVRYSDVAERFRQIFLNHRSF